MFAHRGSDCHLGWQIIKCVNQGQAWKWQGEVCAEHQRKGFSFCRGEGDRQQHKTRRASPAVRGSGSGRRWHTQNIILELLLAPGGKFYTKSPSAQLTRCSSPALCKGPMFQPDKSVHCQRCSLLLVGRCSSTNSVRCSPADTVPVIGFGKFLIVVCN